MSNWSQDEVNTLKQSNGGGNAVARITWHGGLDETGLQKPAESCSLAEKKQFVRAVYVDRRFFRALDKSKLPDDPTVGSR